MKDGGTRWEKRYIEAHIENGNMTLVPRELGMNVLGSRWIHTVKLKADGSLDKLKSRDGLLKGMSRRKVFISLRHIVMSFVHLQYVWCLMCMLLKGGE